MEAAVVDAGPLPLMGRVASTIFMLWEASFSLGGGGVFGGGERQVGI